MSWSWTGEDYELDVMLSEVDIQICSMKKHFRRLIQYGKMDERTARRKVDVMQAIAINLRRQAEAANIGIPNRKENENGKVTAHERPSNA